MGPFPWGQKELGTTPFLVVIVMRLMGIMEIDGGMITNTIQSYVMEGYSST
jgi:hypothetical protein